MRILLVEDHVDSAALTRRLLMSCEHVVEVATCVKEALSLCSGHRFDLLICDLNLPDGNGWALMGEIRRVYHIRGIALSGHADQSDMDKSLAAGFEAHIKKPVDFMHLIEAMKRIENDPLLPPRPRPAACDSPASLPR